MCTTHHRAFTSLEARLGNPSPTCFTPKQAARSRRVSHVNLPPSVLWNNRQTGARWILMSKTKNHHGDFEAQIRDAGFEPELGNSSILVLRFNQETRAPHLHVHFADHTRRYLTSRSSGTRHVLDYPGPLHQVSYSCIDPHRCR
jgi:hypothetical protein